MKDRTSRNLSPRVKKKILPRNIDPELLKTILDGVKTKVTSSKLQTEKRTGNINFSREKKFETIYDLKCKIKRFDEFIENCKILPLKFVLKGSKNLILSEESKFAELEEKLIEIHKKVKKYMKRNYKKIVEVESDDKTTAKALSDSIENHFKNSVIVKREDITIQNIFRPRIFLNNENRIINPICQDDKKIFMNMREVISRMRSDRFEEMFRSSKSSCVVENPLPLNIEVLKSDFLPKVNENLRDLDSPYKLSRIRRKNRFKESREDFFDEYKFPDFIEDY